MPSVSLASSALAGGAPVTVSYRTAGAGPPLVFLHGGWGYDIYPVDSTRLPGVLTVSPDRSGYGRSTPVPRLPPDFHRRAVDETAAVLDALGIERAVWWGHSDGAVIAAWAGIEAPERTAGVVLEALHLSAVKPRSRKFFEQMATDPDAFGPRIGAVLAADHGEDRWRQVLRLDGQAWLDLAETAAETAEGTAPGDLYAGRLPTLSPPALVVHGGHDPRTEPGELAAILAALPDALRSVHPAGRHSPHSERATSAAVLADIAAFTRDVSG